MFVYNDGLKFNTTTNLENGVIQLFQNNSKKNCTLSTNASEILIGDTSNIFKNSSLETTIISHIIKNELGSLNAKSLVSNLQQLKSNIILPIQRVVDGINESIVPDLIDQSIKDLNRFQNSGNLGFAQGDKLSFLVKATYKLTHINCLVNIFIVENNATIHLQDEITF
jgi:hypothetical protein